MDQRHGGKISLSDFKKLILSAMIFASLLGESAAKTDFGSETHLLTCDVKQKITIAHCVNDSCDGSMNNFIQNNNITTKTSFKAYVTKDRIHLTSPGGMDTLFDSKNGSIKTTTRLISGFRPERYGIDYIRFSVRETGEFDYHVSWYEQTTIWLGNCKK